MFQKLSYLNLILAIVYLLVYLRSGTFNSTAGIFVIIAFNWLGLRSFELDDYQWNMWQYLTGLWSLYFIGTLIYGSFNILSASLEFNYINNDTLINISSSFVFCLFVIAHFILYGYKSIKHLKSNL